ncbi:acyltransferase family protein [Thalassotalea mangrovi]|uniref:Acyltransferase n=1 Tax=Thalassotalea mangrovi TaxID=2572245 RepID=A0A4U1B408_9GAMM|nr:acyltransferase [Thalassotalea mangrovi]TKB44632.1 acyltransferase [Thalassotalea mangrovi]
MKQGVGLNLSAVVDGKNNNFNLIRMFAAVLVIFSHSFPLATSEKLFVSDYLGISLGWIAVDIFFITSGLLVCKSLLANTNLIMFTISRLLRIYPALLCSVILCCLWGAFITDLPLTQYLTHIELRDFLFYNSTIIFTDYQNLPGVFLNAPFDRAVNGSLWTLPWELRMYAVIAGLGMLYVTLRKFNFAPYLVSLGIIGIASCSLVLCIYAHFYDDYFATFYEKLFRFTALFFIGGTIYLIRKHIYLNLKYLGAVILVVLISRIFGKEAFYTAYVCSLGYIILCLAYLPTGRILSYNKLGDYSYGMYIYAWPVQQSLVIYWQNISPLQVFLFSFTIALCLSIFSWHLIEKPSLKLKSFLLTKRDKKTYSILDHEVEITERRL